MAAIDDKVSAGLYVGPMMAIGAIIQPPYAVTINGGAYRWAKRARSYKGGWIARHRSVARYQKPCEY